MARFLLQYGTMQLVLPVGHFHIGRGTDCDLCLAGDLVSRHHAVLDVEEYQVRLIDLQSRNGVCVNGERIREPTCLNIGDHIRIGDHEMRLRHEQPPSDWPASPVAPTGRLPALQENIEDATSLGRLSPRELQVLELLAQGYMQREVAERLGVSAKTVETYRSRLAVKLGLQSRADLVRFALDAGLIGRG